MSGVKASRKKRKGSVAHSNRPDQGCPVGTPSLTEGRIIIEQREYLYAIGLGSSSDWQAGTGSFYYIEDRRNERALPVFTTQESVDQYIEQTLNRPEAHWGMLESIGLLRPPELAEGNFVVMPLAAEVVEEAAAKVRADYLILDPHPGDQQEIRRFSE